MRYVGYRLAAISLLALAAPIQPAAAQSCVLLNNCKKPKPNPSPPRVKPKPVQPKYTPPSPPKPASTKPQIEIDFGFMQPSVPVELFPYDDATMTVDRAATVTAAFLRNSDFRRFNGIASDKNGYAVYGIDVVASREQNKTVYGYADTVVAWRGALWKFSSRQNVQKFIADPASYLPAYDGFCAYCLAINDLTSGKFVLVYKDQLFLFANEGVRSSWQADPASYIKAANANFNVNVYSATPLPQDDFSRLVSIKLSQ